MAPVDDTHPLLSSWKLWHADNTLENGTARDKYTDISTFSDVHAFWINYRAAELLAPRLGPNHGVCVMRTGESPRWQEQMGRPGRVSIRVGGRNGGLAGALELFEELLMLAVGGKMDREIFGVTLTNKNVSYVLHVWHEGNVDSPTLLDCVREAVAGRTPPVLAEYHPLY